MANALGSYNPIMYANEALIQLEAALGMANRVYRGYEAERRSFNKGETININRPSTFTAQDAPSTAQDLETGTVQISLDHWKEVKFKLTDKDLSFTDERIINDHIRPAAYALADFVDQKLAGLANDIPWYKALNASPGSVVSDLTGPRGVLFDNKVPLGNPADIHFMVDGTMEAGLLGNSAFTQYTGAGPTGEQSQLRGTLGTRFGMEIFANQNTISHTAGSLTGSPLLNGAVSKGATTVALDATSLTGTLKVGDILTFAGNTQQYVVTGDVTAASNAIASVGIFPAAADDYADNAAVTVFQDDYTSNLAFHRNAFALAMAPLSDMAAQLGPKVATVTDPKTNLSIRSRMYYVGNSSEVHVALDILFGVKTLDPNLACLGCG